MVIQLDGGNDGINTVVPFADDGYGKHRRELRLPAHRLLKITDGLALHPSMRAAADLFEQGRLSVVQGVGYPNSSRSHEVSMATWHTARLDRKEHDGYGWVGRALDDASAGGGWPDSLSVGDGATPRALWGRRSVASSLNSLDHINPKVEAAAPPVSEQDGADGLRAFLHRKTLEAYATAETLAELGSGKPAEVNYPTTDLADLDLGNCVTATLRLVCGTWTLGYAVFAFDRAERSRWNFRHLTAVFAVSSVLRNSGPSPLLSSRGCRRTAKSAGYRFA